MAPKHLLIVTVTKGFRHGDSISVLQDIVPKLGADRDAYTVDFVRDDAEMKAKMTPEALRSVDAVFFGNTTGDLPLPDRDGFLKWLAEGKAFIGVHSATDTFHNWRPYLEMIGAEFETHGPQAKVEVMVGDPAHPASRAWGGRREVFDEIYLFKNCNPGTFRNLLFLEKHPNNGKPGFYPISWCKRYGKGRVFYTALGHRPDVWQSDWYQAHLRGGIRWALGQEKGEDRPR